MKFGEGKRSPKNIRLYSKNVVSTIFTECIYGAYDGLYFLKIFFLKLRCRIDHVYCKTIITPTENIVFTRWEQSKYLKLLS